MTISVIVPTLDEASEIDAALDALAREAPDDVVIADGGSTDGTPSRAAGRARVVVGPRGRARQLNAGARVATGDVLLFLHADCRLPGGALADVRTALESQEVIAGGFHKRFESSVRALQNVRWRTTLWHRLGYVFGDQAMFVRRDAFERVGGFREAVRAEDMDLAWRLRRTGRVVLLPQEVSVSARRLERDGILPTWSRWWAIALRQAAAAVVDGPRRGDLG